MLFFSGKCIIYLTVIVVIVLVPLDGESAVTRRDQLLEDLLEVLGHLLEGEEDGLELLLLEDVHQVEDLLVTSVQLVFPVHQFLFLLGERDELVEGLLVDVAVLFQLGVGLLQLLEQLFLRHVLVLAEGVGRQGAQVPDLFGALLNSL